GNLRRTSLPWSYVFGSASRGLQGGLCDSTTHRCFVRPLVFNLLSRLCADFLSRERSPPIEKPAECLVSLQESVSFVDNNRGPGRSGLLIERRRSGIGREVRSWN